MLTVRQKVQLVVEHVISTLQVRLILNLRRRSRSAYLIPMHLEHPQLGELAQRLVQLVIAVAELLSEEVARLALVVRKVLVVAQRLEAVA